MSFMLMGNINCNSIYNGLSFTKLFFIKLGKALFNPHLHVYLVLNFVYM